MVQPARVELRVDWGTPAFHKPALQPEGGLAVSATSNVHGWENTRNDSVDKKVVAVTVRSEEENVVTNLKQNNLTSDQRLEPQKFTKRRTRSLRSVKYLMSLCPVWRAKDPYSFSI